MPEFALCLGELYEIPHSCLKHRATSTVSSMQEEKIARHVWKIILATDSAVYLRQTSNLLRLTARHKTGAKGTAKKKEIFGIVTLPLTSTLASLDAT